MASSSSSSAFSYITIRESFRNLPNSQSFGQISLPNTSKSELSPSTLSIEASSPSMIAPIVTTSTSTSTIPTSTNTDTDTNTVALSSFWREVQGCNNWENLIDPLHPLLRREIIRYGEFVTACYKAFDLDPNSRRYLNCKYGKNRMLSEVGMGDCGYEVVKYIYATPDASTNISIPIHNSSSSSSCGRWIGFVAVSSDEASQRLGRRDIVVTFRGTVTSQEWVANLMSSLTPARLDPNNNRSDVKVESGFLSLYTSDESSTAKFGLKSCREQLLSEVSKLVKKYNGENLSLTMAGHSMGSALAMLLAYDVAELGLNRLGFSSYNRPKTEIPLTVFSFGGPRVGNLGFKKRCEELGVKVLRIANVNDPITKLPGVLFNERFRVSGLGFSCYAHVGVELLLDFFSVQNPSCVHDLESYINCLLKCSNSTKDEEEDEGFQFQVQFQVQMDEVMSNLMEKGREMLLSSHHNINVLPGVLAGAGDHDGVLGWLSSDILSSWGNELLFGLVLLLM